MRKRVKMSRLVRLREAGRDFDIDFWQKLGARGHSQGCLIDGNRSRKNQESQCRSQA